MDEFNNKGQNGYEQSRTVFNDQPNNNVVYEIQPQYDSNNGQTEKKGLSIAAMIFGILSILSCIFGPVCWVLGLAGIIMGIFGRKRGGKGMGTAGIICGSVGLVLSILIYSLAFFAFSSLISNFSNVVDSNLLNPEYFDSNILDSDRYDSDEFEFDFDMFDDIDDRYEDV